MKNRRLLAFLLATLSLGFAGCGGVGSRENPFPSYSGVYRLESESYAVESFPKLAAAIEKGDLPEEIVVAQGYFGERQGVTSYPVLAYAASREGSAAGKTSILFDGEIDGDSLVRLNPWAGGLSHSGASSTGETCYSKTKATYDVTFDPPRKELVKAYFPCAGFSQGVVECLTRETSSEGLLDERAAAFNALPASLEVSYQLLESDIVNESCSGSFGVSGGGFRLKYVKVSALESQATLDLRAVVHLHSGEPEPEPTEFDRVTSLPDEERLDDVLERFVRGLSQK